MTFSDMIYLLPKASPSAILLALVLFATGSIVSSLNSNSWMKSVHDEHNLVKELDSPDDAGARDLLSKDILRKVEIHTRLSVAISQLLRAMYAFKTTFTCLGFFILVGFIQLIWSAFSGGSNSLDWDLIFIVGDMLLVVLAFCVIVDFVSALLRPIIVKTVDWILRHRP